MVHIVNGQMVDSRSPWRLSIIPEIFWGVVNFVSAFFQVRRIRLKQGRVDDSISRVGVDRGSDAVRWLFGVMGQPKDGRTDVYAAMKQN